MTTPNSTAARPVTAAVAAEVRSMGDLTEHQITTAAMAKALAQKIDQASTSKTGAVALAVGALIKELRSTMEELRAPAVDATNAELMRFITEED